MFDLLLAGMGLNKQAKLGFKLLTNAGVSAFGASADFRLFDNQSRIRIIGSNKRTSSSITDFGTSFLTGGQHSLLKGSNVNETVIRSFNIYNNLNVE